MTRSGSRPRPDLASALVASSTSLRSRIIEAVRRHTPAVHPVCLDEDTAKDLEYLFSMLLTMVGDGRVGISAVDTRRLADVGASCAIRNCPIAELLAAYRVPLRVVVDYVRELGTRIGSSSVEVLDTVDLVLDACNSITTAVAGGYYSAEPTLQTADRQRAEFVRGLLWGTLSSGELGRQVLTYHIDDGREYVAMRARPVPGSTVDELARAHGFVSGRTNSGGLSAVVHGELVGFFMGPPPSEVPGVSGIGPPRPLERLHESFRMASRALHTADRRNLAGVHEFGELGLLPAMFADGAIGAALCRKYLTPLGDKEFAFEIADTLRAYLIQGMNVARAAERMFVHPNTVRYRISRFEELTGVSLRNNPTTAFEVLWALEHWSSRAESAGSGSAGEHPQDQTSVTR